jgi:hypothetical protein
MAGFHGSGDALLSDVVGDQRSPLQKKFESIQPH